MSGPLDRTDPDVRRALVRERWRTVMHPPYESGTGDYTFGLPKEWHRIDRSLHRLGAWMSFPNDDDETRAAVDSFVEGMWETIEARMIELGVELADLTPYDDPSA